MIDKRTINQIIDDLKTDTDNCLCSGHNDDEIRGLTYNVLKLEKALVERDREIKDILIDYRHHLIGSYPHSIREAEEDVEAFLKEWK